MTNVRANCPQCGDVALRSADVSCLIWDGGTILQYRFLCPECRLIVIKDASRRIIDLLRSVECEVIVLNAPRELWEVSRFTAASAINTDDVIDFHLAIKDEMSVPAELTP